ncbi:hypothetical protein HAHI6034_06325 [Hathewaya histolytica]|uniref:Uncharacterized protein n=1 Tax=Hathewaya histolytica TaxID=1498 RepID=A0A4U9RTE4_HATHI|nr:hypothetical protein [Hathewaya histolytica]VTQ95704.1 Uncharacterised protein [Hathewaya histolytica]
MKKTGIIFVIGFSLIVLLLSSVIFMTLEKNKFTNIKVENTADKTDVSLEKFFPLIEGKVLNYSGSADFMESLTVSKITTNSDKKTIVLKGKIVNMEEMEQKKEQSLEYMYEIFSDYVRITTKNSPRYPSQSIIDSNTIIRYPLKINNSWTERVIINGTSKECIGTIINITKDSDNKSIIKVQYVVNNLPKYPNNTYKEIRTYKEGLGMYEFENTILLDNEETSSKPTPFEFKCKIYENN